MTDLNKEREAFEYWADAKCYYLDKREDGHYEKGSTALAWEIAQYFIQVGRNQELEKAKASAVPEQIADDIQSWIAVESIQAMELDGETFVVGANELAEFITQLVYVESESGAEG